ncbi:response regulator [Lusitaniella coriacea LEGE 07157]|uniref:Response regulator n=1 Tax=Lusitaniella coriacea LEGE 07157 TaxID=945747 RepID=A0A8J7DNE7_9CYAN|nr:response regulator [Lusitaniella coriacea]MBE9114474.1 response regulator [Lusitaniella coriacea LEGE 07157]
MTRVKQILIIDDDEDIREVVQLALETLGDWTVAIACCGQDGLKIAKTQQPDAILLDVMMPDMDGVATFKRLQEQQETQHIPVILLTAKVQPNELQRFDGLGVMGAIAKPFKPVTLARQVAEILNWEDGGRLTRGNGDGETRRVGDAEMG